MTDKLIKRLLDLFDTIINAYVGGGKTWEAEAKGIFTETEKLSKQLKKKPKKKK